MGYITLDVSTSCTGYTIFDDDHQPLKTGKLQVSWEEKRDLGLTDKIYIQAKQLNKIVKKNKSLIKFAAPETPFTGKNRKVGLDLAEVRGALKLVFSMHSIPVLDGFAPQEIKKAVTGNGTASKEEVYQAILIFYPDIEDRVGPWSDRTTKKEWALKTDDIYDSLGIGICLQKSKVDLLIE